MSIRNKARDRAENGKIRPLFMGYDHKRHESHTEARRQFRKPPIFKLEFRNLKPKRLEATRVCRQIVTGAIDADNALFPHFYRPAADPL